VLRVLNVARCRNLTDLSLWTLSDTPCVMLEEMDLSCCALVTDKGLQYLEGVTALVRLDVSWMPHITDDGVNLYCLCVPLLPVCASTACVCLYCLCVPLLPLCASTACVCLYCLCVPLLPLCASTASVCLYCLCVPLLPLCASTACVFL
jgi:hypothetical protein